MAGQVFNDREKSAKVRTTVLDCIQLVLDEDKEVNNWSQYKKDLVRRMSTSILPRLNAGRDDNERLVPEPILGGITQNEEVEK